MGDFTKKLPRKVPVTIRSNKPSHGLTSKDGNSIYSFYKEMSVNTDALNRWWKCWCDTLNYPDTKSLLDFIYIKNDFPWFSPEFGEVVEHFRKSRRMLPLLRDDFARLILPQLHVLFSIKKFMNPRQ